MQNWEEYKHTIPTERNGKWISNWFSNMVPSEIYMGGINYPSVENYYQAMKSDNPQEWLRFANMTPSQAKREGRKLVIVDDWEQYKYETMKKGLVEKFKQPIWKQKLLATGDHLIIEWNNWNDRIWGVSVTDYLGNNLLGKALMEIRLDTQYRDLIAEHNDLLQP